MIRINQLQQSFGKKEVLRNLNHAFEPAQIHGIIGLNGAGKTTFFELLSGFLKPESGSITRNGQKLSREQVAFLETANYFYPNLTAGEYLDIFPQTNTNFDLSLINQLLQLELNELVENYSTGMKKKLALLAILKQDKPVYIFDEPFNGLDLETNALLEPLILRLRAAGKTIFISSHILPPLLTLCDQIHLLSEGHFSKSYLPPQFPDIPASLFRPLHEKAASIIGRMF